MSNSRHSSNPSASIFSKQKAPLPTKDINIPSISVSKPQTDSKSKTKNQVSIQNELEEEPQEMYQNPLYHGHFHDENLGHEHIPGEFDKPEQLLEMESEQANEEQDQKAENIPNYGEENVQEIDEDFDYEDQGASQLSEGDNKKSATLKVDKDKKKPFDDQQQRLSRRIFESKVEKMNVEALPEDIGLSVKACNGVEKYDLPGNTRYENITINTQQIVDRTNKESIRLSALINNGNNPQPNNRQPLLSIVMSPQQQEIYYKMFYLKANTSVGVRELAMVTKKDSKWYSYLEEKAGKMKEKLRDESKILNYMIESVIKLRKHYDSSQETLYEQRKKLYFMANVIFSRKAFEEKLRFEMDYLRHKIEESQDIEKEADLLIAIFSTLSDDSASIRNSVMNEIEHKDIHSLALKKYDEFHDYVNKLDISLQDYRKYYRLDAESDEFKKKLQALLAVLTECDDYSKRTFQEIRALNQRISRELQFLIDKLKVSNFDYQSFFGDLEDSANIVSRLIYFRLEKLPNILQKFEEIDQDLAEFGREKNTDNQRVFLIVESKLKSLRKDLKTMKKLAKNLRDDPRSLLFINFRLKQTQILVNQLKNASNRCNAYLLLIAYLKENLNKMLSHINKVLADSDAQANQSHEAKNRMLTDIISISQTIERQLTIADLKKIDHGFRQLLNRLYEKCEKISNFRPISKEKKELLEKIKIFKDKAAAFFVSRDKTLKILSQKLDTFDFLDVDQYEKNLGLQQIQRDSRVFQNEAENFLHESAGDMEANKELNAIIKDLNETDHFCDLFSESVLCLIRLRRQIPLISFSKQDFSVFSELLHQTMEKLSPLVQLLRDYPSKPQNWDSLFNGAHDFLSIFSNRLANIGKTEEAMLKAFEKGLLGFLGSKQPKMNRYLQELTKEWDERLKSFNDLKSLGSRASTIKELDDQINRKKLVALKSWLNPDDLLEVFIFKEYVRSSEPRNKKLVDELNGLMERIREFYEEPQDFMNNLEAGEFQSLINHLKSIFGLDAQEIEVMLNVYRKGVENREMLKVEVEDNLGHTLMFASDEFRIALLRFNEEIRGIYENNKKEIEMIIDTIKNKGLHDRMHKEMKGLFMELDEKYFEGNGFSLKDITEFVEFSFVMLKDNDILAREMAEMREALIEFAAKKRDLVNNWEELKPNFQSILRILSAFNQRDIDDLLKSSKKSPNLLFFTSLESLEPIKSMIKSQQIEKWYIIWKEILDLVAGRKENNKNVTELVRQLKRKTEEGEYRNIDQIGVLKAFWDVLVY